MVHSVHISENNQEEKLELYKDLVHVCSCAYKDGYPLSGRFMQYPCQAYEIDGDCHTFLYTSQENRTQVLCIRGTYSLSDALTDVRYYKTKDQITGMSVHKGFQIMAQDIWEDIKEDIVNDPEWKLYMTGHSLGGAIATLCGLYASVEGNASLQEVVTFGQPKITNAKGCKIAASLLDSKMVRVVNEADIITRIPYKSPLTYFNKGFYRHFGTHIHIYDKRSVESESDGDSKTKKRGKLYSIMKTPQAIKKNLTSLRGGLFGRNKCFGYYHGLDIDNSMGYIANLEDICLALKSEKDHTAVQDSERA